METINYNQQAIDFLNLTNTSFTVKFKKHSIYFIGDTVTRDIYRVKLKNDLHSYSFDFGQSINNTGVEPTAYDVLAAITKNDPEDFDFFCGNYGYDTDSRQAEKIYKAVCKEWDNISRLFDEDQLEKLSEIA